VGHRSFPWRHYAFSGKCPTQIEVRVKRRTPELVGPRPRWIHKPGIEHGQRAPRYTLQGDAFSRAVLGQAPLEFPIKDAIANMRVIDAAFRSAKGGGWEKP